MKEKIKNLIEFYTKEVDALSAKIKECDSMKEGKGKYLDIQYYLGKKHRTSDVIIELKIILNSESSSKTGTLEANEAKDKKCHASYCRDRKLCGDNDILKKSCYDYY